MPSSSSSSSTLFSVFRVFVIALLFFSPVLSKGHLKLVRCYCMNMILRCRYLEVFPKSVKIPLYEQLKMSVLSTPPSTYLVTRPLFLVLFHDGKPLGAAWVVMGWALNVELLRGVRSSEMDEFTIVI
uniref:Uncharacterized protein n=1 Tax=Cucumis sativus TaxID=3659 RepID=A0A0A0LFR5_CUCSA